MPKKPEGKLHWEPIRGGSNGPHLLLKLGDKPIGHFYPDSAVEDYRTILKKMVDNYNDTE